MRPSIGIALVTGASLVVALAVVILDDDDGARRPTARERAGYGDDEDAAGAQLRAYSKRQVAIRRAKMAAAASVSQIRVVLHVDGVEVDGARMTDHELTRFLQSLSNPVVVFSADADVPWNRAIAVTNDIRTAGVTRLHWSQ